ncbi:MAG: zinc-ribbon domain-containing protein [Pyrinomonadaceae bacterium]
MFCPKCGSKNSIEQKFCRTCGLGLEGSALSLREQLPELANTELERQERNLERFGSVAFLGFGVVVIGGALFLLYQLISKMILNSANPAGGIYLMAFLVFASLALAYVIRREYLNEKRKKLSQANTHSAQDEPQPNIINTPIFEPAAATTGKLLEESTFEPVPSVVEGTTELLKVRSRNEN